MPDCLNGATDMVRPPLHGIRVLDLSRILAGPWCTQLLGDLGAEVIKIERPGSGDDTRHWGPPWLKDKGGRDTDQAAYFFSTNRNKSSVTLDLKSQRGIDILRQLAAMSDVFVENFKPGTLQGMGLDYKTLKQDNPGLIYLSITGFGQTGPMSERPGYDYMIQALSGLMSITGHPDGTPGGGPQRVGVAVSDITTGLYATIAVLSALLHRTAGGTGQHIDLALLDCQVAWLANQAMNHLIGGTVPQRTGNGHPNLVPYQPFPASDGEFIVAVGNDRQFRELCACIGMAGLGNDPRFRTNADRVGSRQELVDILSQVFRKREIRYWLECLEAHEIPCSKINNIKEVFNDSQVKSRNMRIDLAHETAGTVPQVANPIRFSESGTEYRNAPPELGQHSHEVLERLLGYNAETLSTLARAGVI